MKSRKIDYACSLAFPPEDFSVSVRVLTPDSSGNQRVTFLKKPVKEIGETLLDPVEDCAARMIRSGSVIDASSFRNILNITDVADLEAHNNSQNRIVSKYITEHRDEILADIKDKKVVEPVEPKKTEES